ncbi:MAG: thrombospondin type 3 repeat-containing protein [Actinomycetota bacterium]
MREPTLEGFGRKLAIKAGVMVVGSLIVAGYAGSGMPTEGLETRVPDRPAGTTETKIASEGAVAEPATVADPQPGSDQAPAKPAAEPKQAPAPSQAPAVRWDGDTDNDGVDQDMDNCPTVPNRYQADRDGDGTGNACDPTDDRPPAPEQTGPVAG